jgi:hypothetical protein
MGYDQTNISNKQIMKAARKAEAFGNWIGRLVK